MRAGIALRADYTAEHLRVLARRSRDTGQTRRLLALAVICEGGSRGEAAKTGTVGRQIIRDWVLAFNAKGPDGLLTGKAPGQTPLLSDAHRRALAAIIDQGPNPAVDGVVRWRLKDLAAWLFERFGVSVSEQTLSREVRALNYRKLSARPRHHAQAAGAIEDFKKTADAAG